MYKEIISFLKCPICENPLELLDSKNSNSEIISGFLRCKCDEIWEIKNGVLDFRVEEQESINRWSKLTEDQTFEELDEEIQNKTPKNQSKLTKKAKYDIIDYINKSKPKYIIDIATGRGMLLTELAKKLNYDAHLICMDLSYIVLAADRLTIQKYNPRIKVSFISCDATDLPFIDNCFDLSVSLMGISNMGNFIPKALKEIYRVLKFDHLLLNSIILIKEESKGFRLLKEYFKNNASDTFLKLLLHDDVELIHKNAGFRNAELKLLGESIGQKSELDLLPYENEWFGIANVYVKK